MPRVRFEPTTPVFERTKTIHALDGGATVIGLSNILHAYISFLSENSELSLRIATPIASQFRIYSYVDYSR
jgi:hypothetical protein